MNKIIHVINLNLHYCNFLWNPSRDIVCSNISNTFSLIRSYDSLCLCNSCDELNSFFMNKMIEKYVPMLQNASKNSFFNCIASMHASKKPMQWMQHITLTRRGHADGRVACMPSCRAMQGIHIYVRTYIHKSEI